MSQKNVEVSPAPPSFGDVLEARRAIAPYLQRTPLHRYPLLDQLVGAEVYVKHENHQPIGAFKVRGGINLVSRLDDDARRGGVVAASTGNHGQSVAYAARQFGVPATIYVPVEPNPVKVASIRGLGARVVEHGVDFDEARERCAADAHEHGARYIHHGDEPLLVAGVATETLEILEDQPRIDAIIVPLGGGSGAAGACVVAKQIRPTTEVIAVQSEAAPAAYRSWRDQALLEDEMQTFAEGLATRTACALTQQILWEHLDDFVLVTDDELRACTLHMIELTRNLVEPAGAAPLAAALRLRERFKDKSIALICSGGNISPAQLAKLLASDGTRRLMKQPLLHGRPLHRTPPKAAAHMGDRAHVRPGREKLRDSPRRFDLADLEHPRYDPGRPWHRFRLPHPGLPVAHPQRGYLPECCSRAPSSNPLPPR